MQKPQTLLSDEAYDQTQKQLIQQQKDLFKQYQNNLLLKKQ